MSKTYVWSRSDLFPIGTTVKAYPARAKAPDSPPSGPATAEAVVDALGKLTLTLPSGQSFVLFATVNGVGAKVLVGDSSQPEQTNVSTGTLRDRQRHRRALAGV